MLNRPSSLLVRLCKNIYGTREGIIRRTYAQSVLVGTDFDDKGIQQFLHDIHDLMVKEVLVEGTNRKNKVLEFKHPHELEQLIDLKIGKDPVNNDELLKQCKTVTKYSMKTGNPRFHNQFYSGINAYGLAGAWLTEALNTNIHVFEVSPAFTVVEKYITEKACEVVGYKNGDGIFSPGLHPTFGVPDGPKHVVWSSDHSKTRTLKGGSFSNIMATHLGRFNALPEFKQKGMYEQKRMKMYASEEAHYSMVKAAIFLGMGSENVVDVKTDEKGRMIPSDLEKKVEEDIVKGEAPTFVMATSGTPVLGAFDPLNPIADICEKYKLWLHADGCWGGGVMFSEKHRHLMEGVERADSVAWNLHKMHAAPLQSSLLLTKDKTILDDVNKLRAEYLFMPDKCYDITYDRGDKTVQCGRKVDCFKLWLYWKAVGDKGMAAVTDRAFENAQYFTERLKETEGFRLVIPEFDCTNICFWYIPESLRGQEETPEWWDKLSKVAPKIKEGMMKNGTLMIGFQPLTPKGFVNFFRIIIDNAKITYEHMDYVLEEIDRLGKHL